MTLSRKRTSDVLEAIGTVAWIHALLQTRRGRPREVLDWIKRAEAGATRDESQPFVLLIEDAASDFSEAIRKATGE